jgi:hypothetical protein
VKTGPYHEGEIAVQERAGVRAMAAKIGRGIGDTIEPPVARFLEERETLYIGSLDQRGRPWASQLVGRRGFVVVVDEQTLRVDAAPADGDPVLANLHENPAVALLALDLTTRRRFRVNGTARVGPGRVVEVRVQEAFGNCPKYIQRREPLATVEGRSSAAAVTFFALDGKRRELIENSDTFFLATAHRGSGADVSHRGGRPGFVRVLDDRTIVWPDYPGNMMFQSLGNLAVEPRAGLLFVDFAGERIVQLTGQAHIDWDPAGAARVPGAQRMVAFTIEEGRELPQGNPIRWRLREASPHNP